MSHFQHEHILRLLAVCTDHDPFFLILELMEGGDLLSYLRTSRGVSLKFIIINLYISLKFIENVKSYSYCRVKCLVTFILDGALVSEV